jgi:hypothetical protein
MELVVCPVPGGKVPAYPRLDIVDPAECLSVFGSFKKRAPPHLSSGGILPVGDTGDVGKVVEHDACPAGPSPVSEPDRDMLQDIVPVTGDPWDEVFGLPFLAPAPPLTALAALETLLLLVAHDWDLSRHTSMIFFFVTVIPEIPPGKNGIFSGH